MAMIRTKDIWFMSILYTASFGTLMAWCVAFPAVLSTTFSKMPSPPEVDDYTWIGPFVGGTFRVFGGWLADKYGGSTITLWTLILLILASIVAAVFVILAEEMDDPTPNLIPFVLILVGVFITSGMSSGSVFRQIGFLYPPETRGPALGFVTCIASYAAAVIILLLVQGLANADDSAHIVVFAVIIVLYIPTVVMNWWLYKRAASTNQC
jgi:NNP family nitrate/nitrite transporter-like MFS transporter